IRLEPAYASAHNNLGNVYFAQKKYDEAIREFTEAVRLPPDSASAHRNRAGTIKSRPPMPFLSESAVVLPIHRKILAFSFIGWIFDFYDLLLLSFVIASTPLASDLALWQGDVAGLLGTAL